MDLRLTPSEEDFQARLEAWLETASVPEGLRDYGSTPTTDDLPAGREWQQLLAEAGWAALSWSRPFGPGATPVEQALFAEALARRGLPKQLSFVSVELAGPALIAFGTDVQKEAYLEPVRRGEQLWCQLFSEPGAGSDLAAVRTKGIRTDGGWVVSGQKVWTSGAQYADMGFLLARTDPESSRHRGLTCFVLPMRQEGIEVRPIRQMDGEAKFNEVFLDGVRVDERDVLGEVGGGWKVALSILGRERRMLGSIAVGLAVALDELRDEAESRGTAGELFRDRWSRLAMRVQLLRWTWFRFLATSTDTATDPRMSVLKLVSSELQQDVARLAGDVLADDFIAGELGAGWRHRYLASFGATIAGGTSEIQRSILGDRVLGLPR